MVTTARQLHRPHFDVGSLVRDVVAAAGLAVRFAFYVMLLLMPSDRAHFP